MRWTECVVSPGGVAKVKAMTRSAIEGRAWRRARDGLVAQKALEALAGEAFLPAADAGLGLAGVAHDRARADAFGHQQHDLCAPDVLLRRVAVFDENSQPSPISKCDRKGNAGTHPPDSHAASPRGILNRIQTSDLIN